jgi:hypothetical protein
MIILDDKADQDAEDENHDSKLDVDAHFTTSQR